jgi:hypothetical protein
VTTVNILDGYVKEQVFGPRDDKALDWTLKFEIPEVYKGTEYDDTVIGGLCFDGIDDH